MSNSTLTTSSPSNVNQATSSLISSVEQSISSAVAASVSTSLAPDVTTTVEPGAASTSTIVGSSQDPVTNVITSVVTQTPTSGGSTLAPVVVIVTTSEVHEGGSTAAGSAPTSQTASAPGSSTSTSPASLSNQGSNNGVKSTGLSTGGKTAIAVVVPVVVVALLVLAALLLWRKRKQKKAAEEQRRKEVEDYGYNPNNDPTLPAVASDPEMTEDHSGYRGWGTANASTRKQSTTISGGHTQGQPSESGSNGYSHSPEGASDAYSGDPLVNRRETMNSDELGALGAAPLTGNNNTNANGVRRGPSNASSQYSNGARSEGSDDPVPQVPAGQAYDYNPAVGYGYTQHGPYGDGSYGGGAQDNGMPIVRDVSARRNTRIQQGGTYQQGNSGIAQNF